MICRSLPAVFALLFATPLLAAPASQQTLFNFVRPADVVQVATQDASLPQSNAEQTPEGEVLRRVTFNPVARPTLRLTPQTGVWDWSQSGVMSLRIQSAMNWALTLYVTIQSNDGKTLVSRVDLPAGPVKVNAHLFERRHTFFDLRINQRQKFFKFVMRVDDLDDDGQVLRQSFDLKCM